VRTLHPAHTCLALSTWRSDGPALPTGKNSSGSLSRHAARSRQSVLPLGAGRCGAFMRVSVIGLAPGVRLPLARSSGAVWWRASHTIRFGSACIYARAPDGSFASVNSLALTLARALDDPEVWTTPGTLARLAAGREPRAALVDLGLAGSGLALVRGWPDISCIYRARRASAWLEPL